MSVGIEDVCKDGLMLEFVDRKEITMKMCINAVRNNGLALESVPKEFVTKHLVIQALRSNIRASIYVYDFQMLPTMKELIG